MKNFTLISFAVLAIGLGGCSPDLSESPPAVYFPTTIGSPVKSEAAKTAAGLDTISIDAYLDFVMSKSYRSTVVTSNYAYAQAAFTNDSVGTDVAMVKVLGNPLVRMNQGTYQNLNSAIYSSSSNINWYVTGFDGGMLADTSVNVKELAFTGIVVGDTVDKSTGFTITYSGWDGGDLGVVLAFDYVHTDAWGDTTVANDTNTTGFLAKKVSDNGTVHFSAGELAAFTSGVYVRLAIDHWIYHVAQTTTGRNVGIARSNSAEIPLFLKP